MSHLFDFEYYSPTALYFGEHKLAQLSNLIPPNARVLFLYGGGSIKKNGIYPQVVEALKQHEWFEFGGIEPNPSLETLNKALKLVREQNLDFILTVGGGSVIDGGKFLAIAANDKGDSWDLVLGKRPIETALPVGVVLTLAATGSESNGTAVVSRHDTQEKAVFRSPKMRPQFAILDPSFMLSLPDRQLANGLVDAFIHACEQYLTYPVGATIQDGYAEAVLRALVDLADDFDRRRELAWCQNLMWAANQALSGILGVGVPQDWGTHSIGRLLTVLYNIDHARTLSMTQPWLLRETIDLKRAKLIQMGVNVFRLPHPTAEDVIFMIETLYHRLAMPLCLADEGIQDSQAVDKIIQIMPASSPLWGISAEGLRRILQQTCR